MVSNDKTARHGSGLIYYVLSPAWLAVSLKLPNSNNPTYGRRSHSHTPELNARIIYFNQFVGLTCSVLCPAWQPVSVKLTNGEYPMNHKVNTGDWVWTNDLGVMSPARCLCATPVKFYYVLRPARQTVSLKLLKDRKYQRDDSNIWPRSYEPRALPLRHADLSSWIFLLIYYTFNSENLSNFFTPTVHN